jgi:L-seryl-tRNA(Ser) seleniumtransferase
MADNPLRDLPSVNDILELPGVCALATEYAHDAIVAAIRQELTEVRSLVKQGAALDGRGEPANIAGHVAERLRLDVRPKLCAVINATGIVLHTNLGRAPIAEEAARAAYEAARGYLNLEMDLDGGKRSSRQAAIREWVCRLTGAESATAVNNNAAATVLVLRALCRGREAIVSRGQLIEIGGSFRIPEIMSESGAILREVGTTNITRLSDYEKAIGPNTGALMQIHTSNYRVSGFTKQVELADMVAVGKKHGLPVLDDVGSGALLDFERFGFQGEPLARRSIAAGADVVLFSGDKLLGGPQAGLIAGRKEHIQKIEKDPLMRTYRLDKMTLAALEATLRLYLNEERALREVPTLRMLATPPDELRRRAEALAEKLRGVAADVRVVEDQAYVGGGSLPDQAMPSWVVEVQSAGVGDEEMARRLRSGRPAVVGRLRDGRLILDVRTVLPHQEDALAQAVRQALAPRPC